MTIDVLKVVIPSALTFFLAILITPFFTGIFYKYKMWKKKPRILNATGEDFTKIHNTKCELSTPRVGGVIIWISVLLTVGLIFLLSIIFPNGITTKLNFLNRNQTLVPLASFILGALVGLADDILQIIGKGSYSEDKIIYRQIKIFAVIIIGFLIGAWFYYKLGVDYVHIPFGGNLDLGLLFIPFFIIVMLAVFSTSVVDGIDGLSGGILASIFTAYAIISFIHHQINISALCAAIAGGILAFLWFNIPPARFYMGETGMLGLTVIISVIAFMTNSVLILPIIAFPLVATSLSNIIQIAYYKLYKKRVFRVAPLHHHFEAIGWSKEKIVMRYWIIAVVSVVIGTILVLVS